VGALAGVVVRQVRMEQADRERHRQRVGYLGSGGGGGPRGFWMGPCASDSTGWQREISDFKSLVRVIPDYAPGHRALSLAYASAGSSAQAILSAREYVALKPDGVDGRLLLAAVYSSGGLYEKALEELEGMQGPDSVRCWVEKMRGDVYFEKGMYARALEAYGRFVEMASYDLLRSDGFFYTGRVLTEAGRLPEALEFFERSACPGWCDLRARWGKALVYVRQGRTDLARAEAAVIGSGTAGGGEPSPGSCDFLMGEILMGEGRWPEAVQSLRQAAGEAQGPARLRCLTALAEACREAGLPAEARAAVDRCLEINPACGQARYLSAQLWEEQGAASRAAAEFQAFLDAWREADEGLAPVRDARERLKDLPRAPDLGSDAAPRSRGEEG
jgi:tetratricopeptide (TPR) repeat protein